MTEARREARVPNDPIYLDHNATTPVLPEAFDAMLPFLRAHFGNPSSAHVYGARAKDAVEQARAQVAALIGARPEEVVFTSGGTEANNLAIRGALEADPARRHVITTTIEHPAMARPCAWLEAHGCRVTRVGVDADGVLDLAAFERALLDAPALVTVMHANNEIGVLQPIERLAPRARAAGALVHTDAAQAVGKVPIDVRALDVDLLSIAGHKLYAPKGVGALYVRRGVKLAPFSLGAGHERGVRPGTENVASIVALGAACAALASDLRAAEARVQALRDALERALLEGVPGLVVHGARAPRLPNTASVRFPRVSGTALLAATPAIAASTGSACHDGHESASAVIVAMGVPAADALGTVRLTLGRATTDVDVERATAALIHAWQQLARP